MKLWKQLHACYTLANNLEKGAHNMATATATRKPRVLAKPTNGNGKASGKSTNTNGKETAPTLAKPRTTRARTTPVMPPTVERPAKPAAKAKATTAPAPKAAPARRGRPPKAKTVSDPIVEAAPIAAAPAVARPVSKSAQDREASPWWNKIGGNALLENSINGGKHREPWTRADDKLVVSTKLTLPEIAARLNRSYHSVASRRAILKREAANL